MSEWKSATVLDTFEVITSSENVRRCGSCGKHPPYLDFSMCVTCRLKAGLHVEPDAVREALAEARDELRRKAEATKRPAKKAERPRHKEDAGMGNPWTEADDATLRENAHMGCKKVAEMLGRTEKAVSQRAKKTGVSFLEARAKAGNVDKEQCAWCGKTCAGKAGLGSHERSCKDNPANWAEDAGVPKVAATSADLLDSAALKNLPSYPEQPEAVVVHPDQVTQEDVATPEEIAGHCDHVEACNEDPSMTDCGADPCELVTLRDVVKHGGTVKLVPSEALMLANRLNLVIDVLAKRIASVESYRVLPLHLRIQDALTAPTFPYQLHAHSIIEWAEAEADRINRRRVADKLLALEADDFTEVMADVERRTA